MTGTRDPDGATSCGVSGQPAKVPGKWAVLGFRDNPSGIRRFGRRGGWNYNNAGKGGNKGSDSEKQRREGQEKHHRIECGCEGKRRGRLRADAQEMMGLMGTRHRRSQAGEAQAEFGACVVYQGADIQWEVVTQARKSESRRH